MNPPTNGLPIYLELIACDDCGGDGCASCEGRGRAAIRQCPKLEAAAGETWNIIELIDLAGTNNWPLGHGSLHETQSFTDSFHYFRNACALLESQRKRPT